MANTTNFGWETPDDTDLVKDGAAAMRTLGNAIDASFVDLKGGTTGQVLSKNSNTDMDFTWVAQDDSNAIQNAIVDAKGDLITATAADTPARLAVGTNNQVLMADSSTATGLKWGSVAADSLTLLSTTTLNGASTFTVTGLSGSYKHLQIVIRGWRTTTADEALIRFNSDSTSKYKAWTTGITGSALFTSTELNIGYHNNSSTTNFCIINVYDYADTSHYKLADVIAGNEDSAGSTWSWRFGYGGYGSNNAISEVTIASVSSNNFNNGTMLIYGVK